VLGRDDPATLVREARRAVREVDGVTDVKVKVVEPAPQGGGPPAQSRARAQPASVPPPSTPVEMPALGHVIAISSGKGGVGKSTVSANLAVKLAQAGKRVGLMDADIYGPNIPRMFGVSDKPPVENGRIIPLDAHGVKLMSLGFLIERDAPAIWRGPIIMKIIQQFLRDVAWGELDYFLVDLPPGTGDAQLSLVQAVHVAAGIIVTTPQEVAIGDALRGAKMFERVNVPVIGVIENMSYFECPKCSERTSIFLSGGGERLAEELGTPLLGQIPLQAGMADLADEGQPIVLAAPESPASKAFDGIAERVRKEIGAKRVQLPIIS
jgi:ATP-binding protein involved in chromosome partitioning